VFLEATVLLPFGFEAHPKARYPVFLYQGHYHADWATPVPFSEHVPIGSERQRQTRVWAFSVISSSSSTRTVHGRRARMGVWRIVRADEQTKST